MSSIVTYPADLEPERLRLYPNSNSAQLATRVWRCEHGVLAVKACDTLLRARLQAWIDLVEESWE